MSEPSANIAKARLEQAREATKLGHYAQALDGFQWFWDHALEHAPSMSGVRASFFLADWWKLASAYAPAMQALEACCDQVEHALLAAPTRDLLIDLSSLTQRFDQPQRFVDALRAIEPHWDALGLKPHNHFWPDIARAQDWPLFRQLPPSVAVEVELAVEVYEVGCEYWRRRDYLQDVSWELLMNEQAIRNTDELLAALIDAQMLDLQRELCEQVAQLEHQWWIEATIKTVRGYGRLDLIDVFV